ncbi:flocculation protein FLO11 [Lucilia sericata]|uniref:flocculation protein FLO11 n=1 Tax=Lucilia sericata TaxID=13632 RepID=UPI0018A853C5|nr:flocculation protein FLO11 [Lucilia sericata]
MKFFIVLCALVAAATADVSHLSNKYLPPHQQAASAPAVSYSPAPAAQSFHVEAASAPAPAVSYSAPAPAAQSFHVEAASAPAVSYSAPAPAAQSFHVEAASAPAASYETSSFETAAAEPAHTFSSDEGYRYKTVKRRVIRRRRDVSTEYLPPVAASAPVAQYESAPVESYAAPAASYESYEVAAAEPAHSFSSAEGYRYRTSKRRVIRRRRRDVSTEYLPPVAASAPVAQYDSAPVESYAAPAASYESYEVAAAEPAHSFSSADGYRYRTSKRRVIRRRRRDVSHLSSEYLPPVQGAGSAPSAEYLPPVAASAPVAQYESAPSFSVAASAPGASYSSYETAASEPAHSFSSAEGYRYKTAKRRVIRRRREVSTEYLPPVAASTPIGQYETTPVEAFAGPAASFVSSAYEVGASEPAHSFSSGEGYRYRTAKRRVIRRRRRDVSTEYLPPVAASAPVAQYESAPVESYAAPAASYESYEVAAAEPAHSFSSGEGYRYRTAKRRVIRRRRRDVSHLSSEYLPPHQGAASAPSAEYLPPVAASAPVAQFESAPAVSYSAPAASYSAPAASYSAPAVSYESAASEPAHSFSSAEGYRYKTAKRRVIRRRRY